MEIIAKDFNNIENSITKYIFKKYIMTHQNNNSNADANADANADKSFNSELYKLFIQKIFDLERHSFRILQDDVLKEDLKQMTLADRAYEVSGCGKNYNIEDFESLPDILRCTFIRKYKHRYYRCKKKIMNDDTDVCKKHENCENIYIDKYNELLEQ